MLWYPQLTTGALVQYPYRWERRQRTIVNEAADGSLVRTPDPGPGSVSWHLRYAGLTDAEIAVIDNLFEASEGGLRSFGFLDPNANLLMWTEDLTHSAWIPGAHVSVTATAVEGRATEFAVTNSGQTSERITQAVGVPAWFEYTLSMTLRADVSCLVLAGAEASDSACWMPLRVSPLWQHFSAAIRLQTTAETTLFGVEVPSGGRVYVRELQVEPQPGVTAYKPNTSRTGVYARTRFAQSQLRVSTYGPNDHRVAIELVSQD